MMHQEQSGRKKKGRFEARASRKNERSRGKIHWRLDTQARIVGIVPKGKRRASEGRERDEVVDRAKNEDRRP